jgi:hypothetical protein
MLDCIGLSNCNIHKTKTTAEIVSTLYGRFDSSSDFLEFVRVPSFSRPIVNIDSEVVVLTGIVIPTYSTYCRQHDKGFHFPTIDFLKTGTVERGGGEV